MNDQKKTLFSFLNRLDFNFDLAKQWLIQQNWTKQLSEQWQEYYHHAPRMNYYTEQGERLNEYLGTLPKYDDFKIIPCEKQAVASNVTNIH